MSIEAPQPEPIADADAAAYRYPKIVAAHVRGKSIEPTTLARVLELLKLDRATFEKDAAAFRLAEELGREAATYTEWSTRLYAAQKAGDRDAQQHAMLARGNAALASRRLDEVMRGNRRVFGWH